MSFPPFFGPRLKIERARYHTHELFEEIQAFLASKPYSFVLDRRGNPRIKKTQPCLVFRAREDLPNQCLAMVGDAVHNLRSALDLMACDLVEIFGGTRDKAAFPFSESKDAFEDTLKQRITRHVPTIDPVILDMLRNLKPYHGGDTLLRGLHDLDIIDKHRTIILTRFISRLPDVRLEDYKFEHNWVLGIADDEVAMWLTEEQALCVKPHSPAPTDIIFARDQPFERKPVFPMLSQLGELVEEIINTFEAYVEQQS